MGEYSLTDRRFLLRQWETGFWGVKHGTIPDVGLVQGLTRGGVTEKERHSRSLEVKTWRQNSFNNNLHTLIIIACSLLLSL